MTTPSRFRCSQLAAFHDHVQPALEALAEAALRNRNLRPGRCFATMPPACRFCREETKLLRLVAEISCRNWHVLVLTDPSPARRQWPWCVWCVWWRCFDQGAKTVSNMYHGVKDGMAVACLALVHAFGQIRRHTKKLSGTNTPNTPNPPEGLGLSRKTR